VLTVTEINVFLQKIKKSNNEQEVTIFEQLLKIKQKKLDELINEHRISMDSNCDHD
ncbi:Hypothetical protein KVN_LOCUS27, partial [uncultured virus]